MSDGSLRLTIHGARGSVPTPEGTHRVHGGDTTCLELALSATHRLILDCGSGLRSAEANLPQGGTGGGLRFDVLMTHYHLDHVLGLPFFKPLYNADNLFTFYGFGWNEYGVRAALENVLRPPWFPVALSETVSQKRYVDLGTDPLRFGELRVRHAPLNHPQGAVAFRLDHGSRSVVLATDHERGVAELDAGLQQLSDGADLLIHDAQYTPEEYESAFRGWGHSSWRQAIETARMSNAKRLLLFHHDPDRTDSQMESIVRQATGVFPEIEAARDGMSIEF
ncbi:MAG: MBL fold metallo-hydrolase [bacterium]|nr:MBL fold metallo-hydrolase [bacterium]